MAEFLNNDLLGKAILSLGEPDFAHALLQAIESCVPIDHLAIVVFDDELTAHLAGAGSRQPGNVALEAGRLYERAGFSQHDPGARQLGGPGQSEGPVLALLLHGSARFARVPSQARLSTESRRSWIYGRRRSRRFVAARTRNSIFPASTSSSHAAWSNLPVGAPLESEGGGRAAGPPLSLPNLVSEPGYLMVLLTRLDSELVAPLLLYAATAK